MYKRFSNYPYTVESLLSGTLLSGHPVLSGQLAKSQISLLVFTVNLTPINQSPLLCGGGHRYRSPNSPILLYWTSIKRSPIIYFLMSELFISIFCNIIQ